MATHLGCGHSPDLIVVWSHENVCHTRTHLTENPLVEVDRLRGSGASLESRIDHTINALDLILLGKHGDVVLERVGNPLVLATDVGDTLVVEPVALVGESLVKAVIEVLVVGEDNVTANIEELELRESVSQL